MPDSKLPVTIPSRLRSPSFWTGISIGAGLLGFAICPLLPLTSAWLPSLIVISVELLLVGMAGAYWARHKEKRTASGNNLNVASYSGKQGDTSKGSTSFFNDPDEKLRDVKRTTFAILVLVLAGLIALLVFATSVASPLSSWKDFAKLFGSGTLYSGAFFAAGALAGFLFGIPRRIPRKRSSDATADSKPAADSTNKATDAHYATNTNLEEISDWLTKIIVGLGLINLKAIPGHLKALASFFSTICPTGICDSISLALMMYFSITGFFLSYLLTRLYLMGAFSRAEQDADKPVVTQLQELPIAGVPIDNVDLQVKSIVQPQIPPEQNPPSP